MLSFTFLLTSLLLSFAAAQSNTTTPNLGSVDLTTKNQWCQSELVNCPTLCGGMKQLKSQDCVGSSLPDYSCICVNNSSPANIADYQGTIPNFLCQESFKQCRIANPGSQACITCATLQPSNVQAIATTSSSAAATSSTGSTTTAPPSTTATNKSGAGRAEAMGGIIGLLFGLAAIML